MDINEIIRYLQLFRNQWDENSSTKNAFALDQAIERLQNINICKKKYFDEGVLEFAAWCCKNNINFDNNCKTLGNIIKEFEEWKYN